MPPRRFNIRPSPSWHKPVCSRGQAGFSDRFRTTIVPLRSGYFGEARLLSSQETTADSLAPRIPLQSPRWLSDLRARIGKCILFGCTSMQVADAAVVLRALASEWRQLMAGSEGFLTGGRRGMEGQKVVWGEMDSFNHVNNVTYARYAESSRINWITSFALHADPVQRRLWLQLIKPISVGLILKSMTTEFKFPLTYPDTISVYHKLHASPTVNPKATSIFLDCMILSHRHQRIGARTFEDISIYDYKAASKTQLPTFMHDVLAKVWLQQEEETVRARARIRELEMAVERLEKQTWDRVDAVEDLGKR